MTKILFVITRFDPIGGAQVHVRDIANSLDPSLYLPALMTGGCKHFPSQHLNPNVRIYSAGHSLLKLPFVDHFRFIFKLIHAIYSFDPDIISLHSSQAGFFGRIIGCFFPRVKIIYTAHGWSLCRHPNLLVSSFALFCERILSRFCHQIITVSETDRQYAISNSVASPAKVSCILNGMHDVPMNYRSRPRYRQLPLKFIMVARFESQKNHKQLIDALAAIDSASWTCAFLGGGRLKDSMISYVDSLHLSNNFSFLSPVSKVAPLLSSFDAFIL